MLTVKRKAYPKLRAESTKSDTKGDFRNTFQRDRDRIMYSKAFRRLSGKTQVFVTGYDDHLRTRLTHTLEVAQIAKTIGAFLTLNCHLIEAIAYGHDIGHAPFGHVGERIINFYANGCEEYKGFNKKIPTKTNNNNQNLDDDYLHHEYRGFKHNWQAIRILEDLATHKGKVGLEISNQTLFGILNHTKLYYHKSNDSEDRCKALYRKRENGKVIETYCKLRDRDNKYPCKNYKYCLKFYEDRYRYINKYNNFTFETLVVSLADEIAQRHHDIEDGIRFKIIDRDEVID